MNSQEIKDRLTKVMFTYFVKFDSDMDMIMTLPKSTKEANAMLHLVIPILESIKQDANKLLLQETITDKARNAIQELKDLGLSDNDIKKELGL